MWDHYLLCGSILLNCCPFWFFAFINYLVINFIGIRGSSIHLNTADHQSACQALGIREFLPLHSIGDIVGFVQQFYRLMKLM